MNEMSTGAFLGVKTFDRRASSPTSFLCRGYNVDPCMGGWPGDVSEEPVTQEKRKKDWITSCDVGEATEGLENEL